MKICYKNFQFVQKVKTCKSINKYIFFKKVRIPARFPETISMLSVDESASRDLGLGLFRSALLALLE